MARIAPASTTGEIFCDTGSAAMARASGLSSRTLARRRAAATADAAALCALSARTAGVSVLLIMVNHARSAAARTYTEGRT